MHPFCCVSTVSDHSPSMPPLPESPQPPLPIYATSSATTPFNSTRSEPIMTRSASQNHSGQSNNNHNHNHNLVHSFSFNHQSDVANRLGQRVLALPAAVREPPVDFKINDIVGNGIAGILYKWVNYGRGWRPRWFVLQDGVLSYYKIHGPDKIFVSPETEKGSKVIGDESALIMKTGGWWYKDRLGRSRGPCELITLKTAYGAGIIDRDTFIWGEDMDEWAPIHMVYGLEPAIATWEVRLGAAATAFLHKLHKGIPPWVPLKGREPKTYKQLQLQKEAIESKKRDMAVLEANDGVWPGVRTPSHALDKFFNQLEVITNVAKIL